MYLNLRPDGRTSGDADLAAGNETGRSSQLISAPNLQKIENPIHLQSNFTDSRQNTEEWQSGRMRRS